jgi:3alpha(or 20beta)-hydroxysteroid dehydrogenase
MDERLGNSDVVRAAAGGGRLRGKVALITGGARGQGAAEAGLFVAQGATVVITDVLDDAGRATAAALGPTCTYLHHDVTSEADWKAVVDSIVETHGRLDVLVNNAGIFEGGGVLGGTRATWDRTIAINQTGVYLGMTTVAPVMVENRSGSIVNISSVAGLQGTHGFLAYGASKWAVRGMTKSAARELAPFGVRVNSVHPGIIDTPMLQTFTDLGEGVHDAIRSRIPMGRYAEAVEVGELVLFLATDESRYSTGSEFVVDGGWMT